MEKRIERRFDGKFHFQILLFSLFEQLADSRLKIMNGSQLRSHLMAFLSNWITWQRDFLVELLLLSIYTFYLFQPNSSLVIIIIPIYGTRTHSAERRKKRYDREKKP